MKPTSICLYFGSFNPIHIGHLALARYARDVLHFDEVWLVLSPLNPLKRVEDQLPFDFRLQMLKSAIAPYSGIRTESIELILPAPRYTIRTIRALEALHPEVSFSLLIGADNLLILDRWHDFDRLLRSVPLFVYPRPGYDLENLPEWTERANLHLCQDAPQTDISSSQIRAAVRSGDNLSHWLPSPEYWGALQDMLLE